MPYPFFNRVNPNTIPSVAVTVGVESVTVELPNHAFMHRGYVGGFYLDLRQAVPAGTSPTLPVLIGTNGDTRPLITYGKTPVLVENLSGTGIYLVHYNKYTNELFLVSHGYKPSSATPTVSASDGQEDSARKSGK